MEIIQKRRRENKEETNENKFNPNLIEYEKKFQESIIIDNNRSLFFEIQVALKVGLLVERKRNRNFTDSEFRSISAAFGF